MLIVIVGAGTVGLNVARSLRHLGHEVVLIESDRGRYESLSAELGEGLQLGDATEIPVLERAGIARCDLLVAVTSYDLQNLVIAEIAKLEYAVPKVVARVNEVKHQATFDLLDVDATVCATTMLVSLIQHELLVRQFVPLLSLKRENLELVEIEVSDETPAASMAIHEIRLPEGVVPIAVLRTGEALPALGSQVIQPGDRVVFVLEPGKERRLIRSFLPGRRPEDVQAGTSADVAGE